MLIIGFGLLGLVSLAAMSCSAAEPLRLPALVPSIQTKAQDGADAQLKSSGDLQLTFSEQTLPEPVAALLKAAESISILESGALVSISGNAGVAALSVKKQYDAPPALSPAPEFAAGKRFLPLNESITDFWLVGAEAGTVQVVRPLKSLASAADVNLPEHMLATLKADAKVVGFSDAALLMSSAESLWIVRRQEGKLTVSEIGTPVSGATFVAAGVLSGRADHFWFATSDQVWVISPQGDDWSAREFKLKLSGVSGSLTKLSAVLELSGETLQLKGPLIARVGDAIATRDVSVSMKGPETGGTPGTPMTPSGEALTFAQAQALCNACHATTSGNNAAKAKLVGTENIQTWIDNKVNIIGQVDSNLMPPGRMWDAAEKAKFINFAGDPVP